MTPAGDDAGNHSAPKLDLSSGCVVITGGGGLLGRALALAFAHRGANVVLADLNAAAAEAVAMDVRRHTGVGALAVAVDVTDRADMDSLASAAQEMFGAVRVLCNNAGRSILKPFVDLGREDWDSVLGVALQGVLNGITAFLPHLVAQTERTHIVNTASMSGVGRADLRLLNAPYVTAKFAVVGLSEVMGPALAEHDIGVSVLCPGFTRLRPEDATSFPMPRAEWYRDNVLPADAVAEETIVGILENRLHIFPHRRGRDEVIDRHELLMAGFDQADSTSPPVASRAGVTEK